MPTAGGKWYDVRQVTLPALGEVPVSYDFQPDQIIAIAETMTALGIEFIVDGIQGGGSIPLYGQGPIAFPGLGGSQSMRIRNLDAAVRVVRLIAQQGYPPTQLVAPILTSAAGMAGVWQTLVDQADIAWNMPGGNAQVTIAGNRNMANPTNVEMGAQYFLLIIQDAVGGRTMTWGNGFLFPGGAPPVLSYRADEIDMLEFMCDGNGDLHLQKITKNMTNEFDPLTLGNVYGWYRGDSFPGLGDGDPVATWVDQGPGGNNLAQGVAVRRPLYRTGIVNGQPALQFDGVDDRLFRVDNIIQPYSIYVVAAHSAGGGDQVIIHSPGTVNTLYMFRVFATGLWQYHNGGAINDGPVVPGDFELFEDVQQAGGGIYYMNSVLIGGNAFQTGNLTLPSFGATNVPGMWLNGFIAEVIIYEVNHSAAQRAQVEAYLRGKYNLW